ncbi:polymorphic toxin-type HINT domain-containing protein, partial [Streptomyces sp. NPDC007206]|uniref:polymorphic toxin-type HINT domain-containing protein n=1 Tax=Streptomyces sp. NPDC007206 TaxID=3154317 RepID=UPI00340EF9FB
PTTGRFISLDPLFEATSPQELNGYSYAGDDPVNQADPTGLCPADLCGVGYPIGGTGTSPSNPTRYVNTGPVDPGDSSAGYCHYGSCGRTHYNSGGTAHTSSGTTATKSCGANRMCEDEPALYNAVSAAAARETLSQTLHDYENVAMFAGGVFALVPAGAACVEAAVVIGPECAGAGTAAANSVNSMFNGGANEGVDPVEDPAACSCWCSFDPHTRVLMSGGKTKPIGKIKAGDRVEAADPKTGKHQGPRTVQHVWINHDHDLLDVTIRVQDGSKATLHTTANHPFWDDTTHTWTPAGKLHRGDALNTPTDHHVYVVAARPTPGTASRWNLTVQQLHTYYVVARDTPVLVHNEGCGPVAYGSTDLSQAAIDFRKVNRIGSGQNIAVYRVKLPDGSIEDLPFANNVRGAHSEANADAALDKLGVTPDNVLEIYSERNFCITAGHECAARVAKFTNATLSWSFENGDNAGLAILNHVYGGR